VHVLERIGQPAKQRAPQDGQQEELAKRHHDAGDGQRDEGKRIGPVGRALERGETLDAAGTGAVGVLMPQRALHKVEDAQGQQHDGKQCSAVRNDPVVAHLAPGLARVGNARAGVLHKRLDQVARLGRLGCGQAAVARHALPHLAPHGRVVAGLHLGALAVGLLGILGVGAGVGFDFEDVLALDATGRRGRSRWRLLRKRSTT